MELAFSTIADTLTLAVCSEEVLLDLVGTAGLRLNDWEERKCNRTTKSKIYHYYRKILTIRKNKEAKF